MIGVEIILSSAKVVDGDLVDERGRLSSPIKNIQLNRHLHSAK
jgi:hypothetical protein